MLTRTGLGVAVAAIVSVVAGVTWGYVELIALAGTAAAALLLALVLARSGRTLDLRRRPVTPRVTRGEQIHVRYVVANGSRRRIAACRVFDAFQGAQQVIDIPVLRRHGTHSATLEFLARRRGLSSFGPTSIEVSDQLALASASRQLDVPDAVLV